MRLLMKDPRLKMRLVIRWDRRASVKSAEEKERGESAQGAPTITPSYSSGYSCISFHLRASAQSVPLANCQLRRDVSERTLVFRRWSIRSNRTC